MMRIAWQELVPRGEEPARQSLDAVGAPAEVDRVQVALEDLPLRELPLELDGERCLLDRDEFSERADPEIVRPRVDLVARLELPHPRSRLRHDACDAVAKDEGQAIGQDALELPVVDGAMLKAGEIEIAAEFAIDPLQQVEIEPCGDALGIVIGGLETMRVKAPSAP